MQSISAGERHTLASAAERIKRSLQSGALTQEQLNQAQAMARQFQNLL